MKLISSRRTQFHKRGFPILFNGILLLFIGFGIANGDLIRNPLNILWLVGMSVGGFFFLRKLVGDLADEVYDCGDTLLVKNNGESETIPLAEIINVNEERSNPPRITLRLASPRAAGSEITFVPDMPFRLNPMKKSPIAEDLMLRAHRARLKA